MLKRIKKVVTGIYKDIFKYVYIEPFGLKPIETSSDDWFNKYKVVPHAMGGINGDTYTDSLDAFENSLTNGFNAQEIDVCLTKDGVPVLSHDDEGKVVYEEFMNLKILGKYTSMSLQNLIDKMRENKEIYSLLDIKNRQEKPVVQFLKDNASDIIDRFIIQLPSPKAFKEIVKIHRFKYFHFNFSIDGNVNYNLGFVVKNNIQTCSVPIKSIKNTKTLSRLNKYGVKTYSYTVNTQKLYDELKNKGCYGVITDCPSEIN